MGSIWVVYFVPWLYEDGSWVQYPHHKLLESGMLIIGENPVKEIQNKENLYFKFDRWANEGLFLDGEIWRKYSFPFVDYHLSIVTEIEFPQLGGMWCYEWNFFGTLFFDGIDFFAFPEESIPFGKYHVMDIEADQEGGVWFGLADLGLWRYKPIMP